MSRLVAGEKIVCHCGTHWMWTVKNFIIMIIAFIMFTASFDFEPGEAKTLYIIVFLGIAIIQLIIILMKLFYYGLSLTNKRLVGMQGLFSTKSINLPVGRISSVEVDQGIFGTIFGYGHLTVSTVTGKVSFRYLKKAENMESAIFSQIH